MFYFPILGAVALASGTILEKVVLVKKKMNIGIYQTICFFMIALAMVPLLYFFWGINSSALTLANLSVFFLVILFSVVANVFVFYSLKWEKLNNLEPARMLEPLFVILLAIMFSFIFGETLYERNFKIVIPALIAGCALIFSHVKKHHLDCNKYFLAAIVGSFFFALELAISRLILDFYSPISFYFLRCCAISLISLIIFRPNFSQLDKRTSLLIFITSIFWVVYRVLIYYGYLSFGVVFTTLMIMLGPIFIYAFAHIFLKEKLSWRNIVASIVIIGCVLYGTLV